MGQHLHILIAIIALILVILIALPFAVGSLEDSLDVDGIEVIVTLFIGVFVLLAGFAIIFFNNFMVNKLMK